MGYRATEELVERHVRQWQLEQRAANQPAPPPCVALSRLPASAADELGRLVAEKLDYGFFGIEILDQIAREAGIQRHLLDDLDEHRRSALERYVGDAFRSRGFRESDYLSQVVRTIANLGQRGGAVILGRGAPFILERERALRVLVVAPLSVRIERIAERHGLDARSAERRLESEDARRKDFLGQFAVEPDDPSLFDLVVNTHTLGLDGSCRLILEALQRLPGSATG